MINEDRFTEEIELLRCKNCGITEEETTTLAKCRMCFSMFCSDCAYNFGGRNFCSKACAEYFYFGEGGEEE